MKQGLIIGCLLSLCIASANASDGQEQKGRREGEGRGGGAKEEGRPRNEGPRYTPNRSPAIATPRSAPPHAQRAPERQEPFLGPAHGRASVKAPTQSQRSVERFLTGHRSDRAQGGPARTPPSADFARTIKNRNQLANNIRKNVGQRHPNSRNWFRNDFWRRHNDNWGWGRRNDWWRYGNWNGVSTWLGWGDVSPYYFETYNNYYPSSYYENYLPPTDYNAPYYGDQVEEGMYQGQPAPAPEQAPVAGGDWMPLGVYALTQTQETSATANMFIQLALDKYGDVAGTYYNASTDATHPLEGLVDKVTTEIAWKISDNENSPIFVTGLYNMTQNETPVQVNFADGTSQTWFLVRLQDNQGT